MTTIHAADELRHDWDGAALKDGAVVVEGARISAVGPLADLRERFPEARVRNWPGVLGPARVHEGPLPDAPSPRERVYAVLKLGATAVLREHAAAHDVRAAADRNHVLVLPATRHPRLAENTRADLAVFDEEGACIATVCAGRLVHRRR
ncbi:imidazolonepropionase-like domain-containing protein [Streptomyces fuscichromogenes]|uniref:imidazolonepropionase-like domain-containing protein n=1 Tax=Streptomyces fuscichromogenes TaxID=1324013 RepID=UPI00381DEBDF